MNKDIVKRTLNEANNMIETQNTVRTIAKIFKVSKSTVHKDLHDRLLDIDKELYAKVADVLKYHTNIRHIRGGQSTKEKYLNLGN